MISFSRLNDNNEFLLVMSDSSTVDFPYAMLDDTYLSNDARVIIAPTGKIFMPDIDSHSKVKFTEEEEVPAIQPPTDDKSSHLTVNQDSSDTTYPVI